VLKRKRRKGGEKASKHDHVRNRGRHGAKKKKVALLHKLEARECNPKGKTRYEL